MTYHEKKQANKAEENKKYTMPLLGSFDESEVDEL